MLGGAYVTVGRKGDHAPLYRGEVSAGDDDSVGDEDEAEGGERGGELYKAGSAELPPLPSVAVRPQVHGYYAPRYHLKCRFISFMLEFPIMIKIPPKPYILDHGDGVNIEI